MPEKPIALKQREARDRQKRVQSFSNRNDSRSGTYRPFHDVFEEVRSASVWRRRFADVVRREDQPSARGAVLFNQGLDGVAIVPGFLEEVRAQIIEIRLSNIEIGRAHV